MDGRRDRSRVAAHRDLAAPEGRSCPARPSARRRRGNRVDLDDPITWTVRRQPRESPTDAPYASRRPDVFLVDTTAHGLLSPLLRQPSIAVAAEPDRDATRCRRAIGFVDDCQSPSVTAFESFEEPVTTGTAPTLRAPVERVDWLAAFSLMACPGASGSIPPRPLPNGVRAHRYYASDADTVESMAQS